MTVQKLGAGVRRHGHKHATRLQDVAALDQKAPRIMYVLQDMARCHDIEGVVGNTRRFDVALGHIKSPRPRSVYGTAVDFHPTRMHTQTVEKSNPNTVTAPHVQNARGLRHLARPQVTDQRIRVVGHARIEPGRHRADPRHDRGRSAKTMELGRSLAGHAPDHRGQDLPDHALTSVGVVGLICPADSGLGRPWISNYPPPCGGV